ncbi:MAG: glycoside hydrolase family 5 protein [Chthoniobacteraceae bacterium]
MKRLPLVAALLAISVYAHAAPAPLPEATASHLPRWRGFNLTEKFIQGSDNRPFAEEDFQIISELGFNFARLPMDYRLWIKNKDWKQIDEAAFADIDRAIAYGEKYGVHICLNFHRAPGYTVAMPPEPRNLWTDTEAQEVCAQHWAYFARRYKGIPSRRLSFDLMNEPGLIPPETYRAVVQKLAEAIHREDPQRLVIADGLRWGRDPVPELAALGVAQSTRGYEPMSVSHYRASWMQGNLDGAPPIWPMPKASSVVKQGYPPKEAPKDLVVEGPFPVATTLRVDINKVQPPCEIVLEADGKPLLSKAWTAKLQKPETLETEIPAGTQSFKVHANTGWALASLIGLRPGNGGSEYRLGLGEDWKTQTVPIRFDAGDPARPFKAAAYFDRAWLQAQAVAPWKALEAQGVGVFVGEFGVYNKTPHPVALALMDDYLSIWRDAGWGWALWNLYGDFGILDSQRADVHYEPYKGHKLDRKMLELLQKY